MPTLDLDDLPPRIAKALEALQPGQELVVTRAGLVVARLRAAEAAPPATEPKEPPADMAEVMEHFQSMIEEEF